VPSLPERAPTLPDDPVHVRVVGPDAASPTADDLRRLFHGHALTPARRERLRQSSRVVAVCGDLVVGLAAYERADREVRVHEFGIDDRSPCRMDEIAGVLMEALETACLAAGDRRLVLLPRAATAESLLEARGFVHVAEGCAGSWFEKHFPA
jgi:hypothetical protein